MSSLIPLNFVHWIPGAANWTSGVGLAVPLLVKATIVIGLALVVDLMLQRFLLIRSAAWNGAILLLAALPLAWASLPAERVPSAQVIAPRIATAAASSHSSIDGPRPFASPRPSPLSIQPTSPPIQAAPPAMQAGHVNDLAVLPPAASFTQPVALAAAATPRYHLAALIVPAMLVVYCCGLAAMLMHLLASLVAVVRLRRSTQPVEGALQSKMSDWRKRLGIASAVELRHSSAIQVPIVVGVWRPTIVLPSELLPVLNHSNCNAILVHELAHVARGDAGWQLLQRLVAAVYWFHPLLWIANRRIALMRELVCDEYSVFQVGGKNYMETLLDMASRLAHRPRLSLGMAVVRSSQLGQRLATIHTSRGLARCQSHRWFRLAILAIVLVIAAWAGRSASAESPIPEVPGLPTPAKALTASFEQRAAQLRAEADSQIAAERDKLERSLQKMLEDYTRQAKLDEALAIRDQIRALKAAKAPGAASVIIAPEGATMTYFRNRVGESFYVRLVGSATGSVWGSDQYTDDSSLAAAAVHAGALKDGQSGVVKVTMKPSLPTYEGNLRNGVQSSPWSNNGDYVSYTVELAPPEYQAVAGSVKSDWVAIDSPQIPGPSVSVCPSQPSQSATEDNFPIEVFPQSVGRSFVLRVVGQTTGAVWGTGKYTHDSSISTAAVHAGVLQPGETGFVLVNVLPGIPTYSGSTQHGVTSQDWSNAGDYVSLTIERLTGKQPSRFSVWPIAPAPSDMSNYQQSVGSSFYFNVTGATDGSVWGSDQYTYDSSLAAAAVHSGAVKAGETGIVKVTMMPALAEYEGSTRNGVTSADWNSGDYVSYKIERQCAPKPVSDPRVKELPATSTY